MGGLSGAVHPQAGAGRHVLRRLPQSARQFPPLADPNGFCKRAKLLPMSFRPTRPVYIRARSCEVSRVRNMPPAARFNESADADPLQRASVVPRVSCESDALKQPWWSAASVSSLEKPPIPELHDLPTRRSTDPAWTLSSSDETFPGSVVRDAFATGPGPGTAATELATGRPERSNTGRPAGCSAAGTTALHRARKPGSRTRTADRRTQHLVHG